MCQSIKHINTKLFITLAIAKYWISPNYLGIVGWIHKIHVAVLCSYRKGIKEVSMVCYRLIANIISNITVWEEAKHEGEQAGCYFYERKQENKEADMWLLSFTNRTEDGKPDSSEFGDKRTEEWKQAGRKWCFSEVNPLCSFDSCRCVHVLQV